jgi:hypothetical protein
MIKHNQDGAVSGLLVSFILAVLLLAGAIGFGAWAYMGRQDYKNNVDSKVSAAAETAKQQESAAKDSEFAEAAKKPLKIYNGPEAYGSLEAQYPKTWSGYVDDTGKGGALVDGYFAPGVVPSISDQNSVYSLRFKVLSQSYAQTLQNLAGQQQSGKLNIKAYALPKLPDTVGVMVTGQLVDQSNVTMVVLPLRSQTLEIWTEGSQYLNDFNTSILPNFNFSR